VKGQSPNDILQIPRDASPEEIAAAVTSRTAHLRDLSDASAQQALAEIYQAAAFLLWETKNNKQSRAASGTIPTTPAITTQPRAGRLRRPPKQSRKRRRVLAPLMIMVPTLAALSLFLLYPEDTMSAAWSIVDKVTEFSTNSSQLPINPDPSPLPTVPTMPTAEIPSSSPASSAVIISQPSDVVLDSTPTAYSITIEIRACVAISSLNIRSGPGSSFESISYLLDGECVTLVAQNPSGTWALIETSPRLVDQTGWVSLTYLNYTKSSAPLPVATSTVLLPQSN
jgi:hypothetical protein